jgi:hypothetical protein
VRSYYTDTIVRQRATTTTDEYGNVSRIFPGTQVTFTNCRVQPRTSLEQVTEDRDMTEVILGLYTPINADIIATDRVVFDSVTYEVHDGGQKHRGVTGATAHAYFKIRRVDG